MRNHNLIESTLKSALRINVRHSLACNMSSSRLHDSGIRSLNDARTSPSIDVHVMEATGELLNGYGIVELLKVADLGSRLSLQ
jgi:hypothetical protein